MRSTRSTIPTRTQPDSLEAAIYEHHPEPSARPVTAGVRRLDFELVSTVRMFARVPAAREPEAVSAGRIRMVLARAGRIHGGEPRVRDHRPAEVHGDLPGEEPGA